MKHFLTSFFEPKHVVVIGSVLSPGELGYYIIKDIIASGYSGPLYLIDSRGGEVFGIPVYPTVSSLPFPADLAILLPGKEDTFKTISQCAAKGIRSVIIAAGTPSHMEDSASSFQRDLFTISEATSIRVIAAHITSLISTLPPFGWTLLPFPKTFTSGGVSIIANSDLFTSLSIGHTLTDENIGLAKLLILDRPLVIKESDVLTYYLEDPKTTAIFACLSRITDLMGFLDAAREVTKQKPVFLLPDTPLKVGSKSLDADPLKTSTDNQILSSVLKQVDVTQFSSYSHFIFAAKALSSMPLPKGSRVGFLAPSGAMLVVLTDLCYNRYNLKVPELTVKTQHRLQNISPPYIRMRNPVDIWPSVSLLGFEVAYREAMEALLEDPNIDAVIPIIMATHETTAPSTLSFIVDLKHKYPEKPIYVSFSSDITFMEVSKSFLEHRGVPTFPSIEQPFKALSILTQSRKYTQQA